MTIYDESHADFLAREARWYLEQAQKYVADSHACKVFLDAADMWMERLTTVLEAANVPNVVRQVRSDAEKQ